MLTSPDEGCVFWWGTSPHASQGLLTEIQFTPPVQVCLGRWEQYDLNFNRRQTHAVGVGPYTRESEAVVKNLTPKREAWRRQKDPRRMKGGLDWCSRSLLAATLLRCVLSAGACFYTSRAAQYGVRTTLWITPRQHQEQNNMATWKQRSCHTASSTIIKCIENCIWTCVLFAPKRPSKPCPKLPAAYWNPFSFICSC